MGIRNAVPAIVVMPDECNLITPHGDQELPDTALHVASVTPHYPPWGSGTGAFSGLPIQKPSSLPPNGDQEHSSVLNWSSSVETLITPHGDQEPVCPAPPAAQGAAKSHYPPWGSGTGHGLLDPIRQGLLITPHGDQEPDHRGDDRPVRLPLITPHGDQEPASPAWRGPCARQLITPHGDQEPRKWRRTCPRCGRCSLPPMGIRNTWMPSRAAHTSCYSLSPMGIRNPRVPACP